MYDAFLLQWTDNHNYVLNTDIWNADTSSEDTIEIMNTNLALVKLWLSTGKGEDLTWWGLIHAQIFIFSN